VGLRIAVSDPFKSTSRSSGMEELFGHYHREMFKLPDQVHLCDLLDTRADVLSAGDNTAGASTSHKDKLFVDVSHLPPEVTHNSSRRVRLSLLAQCVGRFVLSRSILDAAPSLFASEDSYQDLHGVFRQCGDFESGRARPGVSSSRAQQVAALHQLMVYGGDAILLHMVIDCSAYTQGTSIDRQYLVWLLRECLVTTTCCRSEHQDRFYQWLLWVLRGNVAVKSGTGDSVRAR